MTPATGRTAVTPAILCLAFLCAGGCGSLPAALDRAYQRSVPPLQITRIGHATCLVALQGQLVLTDPWCYETPFTGKHPEPFGLSPARLPPLDLILVTHDHMDHFDAKALKHMGKKMVPMLCGAWRAAQAHKLGCS